MLKFAFQSSYSFIHPSEYITAGIPMKYFQKFTFMYSSLNGGIIYFLYVYNY